MSEATACSGVPHVLGRDNRCGNCGKTRKQLEQEQAAALAMKGPDMPVAFIRLDLAGISDANLKEFTKFLEEGWNHALEEGRPMVIGTNMQLYYRHEGKYYSLDTGESRGSGEGL